MATGPAKTRLDESAHKPTQGHTLIGIVAADPLRALGLESILELLPGLRPMVLELNGVPREADMAVLILDGRVGGADTTELLSRFRRERPALKIIVVAESLAPEDVQAVIGAGAKGYLAETATESEIAMAMDVVLDGSVWAPRKVLARLIEAGGVTAAGSGVPAGAGVTVKMTPREREVLTLLMDGRSNRSIAEAMKIDEVTVKAHLGRMLRKAGVSNRVELTLRAMEEKAAADVRQDR